MEEKGKEEAEEESKKEEKEVERDLYGFALSKWEKEESSRKFFSYYFSAERTGEIKQQWDDYLLSCNYVLKRDRKDKVLKNLLKGGIPPEYRARVWQILSGAKEKQQQNETLYSKILSECEGMVTEATSQIERDLTRTFPGNLLYETEEGRASMRRVLIAYSFKNTSVGYCQSMNFICAMLLLFMGEEEAFWVLGSIIEDYLPLNYFGPTMLSFQIDQKVFSALIGLCIPNIADTLYQHKIPLPSDWFLCLFATSVPTETLLRIWDLFFFFGDKVLFTVGLALMKIIAPVICKTKDPSKSMQRIRNVPKNAINPDVLLWVVFNDEKISQISKAQIQQLRENYRPVVTHQMEAEKLRRKGNKIKFKD